MKGNKSVYVLLPVVAIVWGLIAYRVVKYVGPGNTEIASPPVAEVKFEPEKFEGDTFSILANYSDPFLGAPVPVKKITVVAQKPKPVTKPAPKPETPWPQVAFHGLIKNKDSKKTYALLTVNGKMKSFSEKDEWQGIKIIKADKDSVVLGYNKQKKSFRKK